MTVTVKYRHLEAYRSLQPGEPLRPYIAVRLQHGGRFQDTLGLIDSGADTSLFHLQWAPVLGLTLDPAAMSNTMGIGGNAATWYFDIFLTVAGRRFPAHVGFSSSMPTAFGLLGRTDFFTAFAVGFDQVGYQALLSPVN